MSQEDIDAAFDDLDEEIGDEQDVQEHTAAGEGTELSAQMDDGVNQASTSTHTPSILPAPPASEALPTLAKEDASDNLQAALPKPALVLDTASEGIDKTAAPLARPALKPSFSRPAFKPPAAVMDSVATAGTSNPETDPRTTTKTKANPSTPAATTVKPAASGPPDPSTAGKRKKGDGRRKKGDGESKPLVPRAKGAYIFFCTAKRPEVKAADPNLTAPEVVKALGVMWKALTPEAKAPFEAQAAADKARVAALRASAPPSEEQAQEKKPKAKAPRAPKPPTAPKPRKAASKSAKSDEHALSADDQTLPAQQEDALDGSQKKPSAAGTASLTQEPSELAACDVVRRNAPRSKEARGGRAPVLDGDEAIDVKSDAEDVPSDDEHMNCDWVAHPAEAIVCKTAHGKYVIKRKGLGFDDYGLVDISAAKRQCVRDGVPCPVSADMVNKHESLEKAFCAEAHARTSQGELDLDDLPPGSLMEMVSFLGNLREPDFPLHKVDNKKSAVPDVMMNVPLMGTCMIFQSMLNIERAEHAALRQELAAAKDTIKQMKASAGGMTTEP